MKKALFFTVLSLICFIPGILLPILSIKLNTNIDAQMAAFSIEALNQTRSIIGTIQELWKGSNKFVAFLIAFFSIAVPVIKSLLLFNAHLSSELQFKQKILKILDKIGKWSMADVFVVAIFICYLSTTNETQSHSENLSVFGMSLKINVGLKFDSQIGIGFYFFLGYCIFSLLGISLFKNHLESSTS
jgi:paraquat-inducible protein A